MQSSTCLLKTGRLADCHRKCFAPRRWRCSHLQPLERVCASARLTWALATQATQLSTIHHLRHLSGNGTGTYDVHVAWTWSLAFSKTRESGAWEHPRILLSAAAVTTSAVVPQRKNEPRPVAVFLKAVILSVFEKRSALHDQRRAVTTACRSSTLVIFLQRDQQKLTTATAKYLCPEPVTASSATVRSSTWNLSRLARSKVPSTFPAAATTPFPSATSPILSTLCVVTRNLRLGKSPGSPRAKIACGNPVTGRC